MTTFIIGLAILFVGGFLYGKFTEKVFSPDDRPTPAVEKEDGIDYVPMSKGKNSLIELLNIAGTGPILGPIQGILFGPIAFILIPIGCVLGGAVHDYFSGMISIRNGGEQMPGLVNRYLGEKVHKVFNVFVVILMLLVGAVFIYTPGDLIVTQIMGQQSLINNPITWIVYGLIFIYYLLATVLPIDKIIGKIYPFFGMVLLLSAVGIFFGIFFKGYPLDNLSLANWRGIHPEGTKLIPAFFLTIACGIVSGFHSTQATLIARSVSDEREGRTTFYNTMILEGFIAMIWAAAAMGIYNKGINPELVGKPDVIGIVANDFLGTVGGIIAILGVIVLPITSGDTALRSVRLMIADRLDYDQEPAKNRMILAACIFIPVAALLIFAKMSPSGFNILWRYFAWANQTVAVFAFAMASSYLYEHSKPYLMTLIPGSLYMFFITAFIVSAPIGFRQSATVGYIVGAIGTILYVYFVTKAGRIRKEAKTQLDMDMA